MSKDTELVRDVALRPKNVTVQINHREAEISINGETESMDCDDFFIESQNNNLSNTDSHYLPKTSKKQVVSRKREMKLRRNINEKVEEIKFWKKNYYTLKKKNSNIIRKLEKFKKIDEELNTLQNENHKLKNRLDYCESVLCSLQKYQSQFKTQAEKMKFAKSIISEESINTHSPDKNLNILNKYYKKKLSYGNYSGSYRNNKYFDIKKKIHDFYLQDENSAIAPGIRDVIIRKKNKQRKRFLTDTINNLYKKFCRTSGNIIGRMFFYKIRPFWVVPQKVSSRDTCLCKQHSNFKFLLNRLRLLRVVQAKNSQEFMESICCDTLKKDCMFGDCKECKNSILKGIENSSTDQTWYEQWVTEEVTRSGSKGLNYTVKITEKKKLFAQFQIWCKFLMNLF